MLKTPDLTIKMRNVDGSLCIYSWPRPLCVFQAGSAHVRIRRDANEQLVLAHVTNRLLPLVSALTVQIFKDDWTRPLLAGTLSSPVAPPPGGVADGYGSASLPPAPFSSSAEPDPLTSTPSKPSSPPPEFSFDTPGRNVAPVVLPGHPAHRPYGGGAYGGGAYPPYGMLGHGPARVGAVPGFGAPGLGAGFGPGTYRTGFGGPAAPLGFGTSNPLAPQSQYRQYRP